MVLERHRDRGVRHTQSPGGIVEGDSIQCSFRNHNDNAVTSLNGWPSKQKHGNAKWLACPYGSEMRAMWEGGLCGRCIMSPSDFGGRKPNTLAQRLAPEAGLEPATRRLTAGCSTIELLWNPNQAAMYRPVLFASKGFCYAIWRAAASALPTLAPWAIIRAAGRLHATLYPPATSAARLPQPPVNLEPLF